MAPVEGLLTLDALARLHGAGEVDTVLVVFTDLYGRFMGKRFDAGFFLESAAKGGTHACDYLLTVDMEMDPVQGYRFANWQRGYGDFHLVPDIATLRRASWLEKTALVICDVEDEKRHAPVAQAPRSILKRQLDALRSLGFTAKASSELEYYIFDDSYRQAAERGYRGLQPAGWYIEDYHALQGTRVEAFNGAARRHLRLSGVPVETSKGEWGLGQHELNVRYAEALEMADRHVVFKQCLKEIAEAQGKSVTFMAKLSASQAGSSCHVHLSLWKDGKNAFAGGERQAGPKSDPVRGSEVFRGFLAGWIAHAPELMAFYAPTVNSYKRFQAASWAPTRLAWSRDNRTAGFRVVGEGESLRIECRIPGADCNPYLAFAAALASGLDGVQRKLEPPPHFEGDAYAAKDLPALPGTLREAVDLFEKSPFARASFGEDVVEHYAHFFRVEQAAFDRAVTDWERQRYFERI
jgi:glutamine synthetase